MMKLSFLKFVSVNVILYVRQSSSGPRIFGPDPDLIRSYSKLGILAERSELKEVFNISSNEQQFLCSGPGLEDTTRSRLFPVLPQDFMGSVFRTGKSTDFSSTFRDNSFSFRWKMVTNNWRNFDIFRSIILLLFLSIEISHQKRGFFSELSGLLQSLLEARIIVLMYEISVLKLVGLAVWKEIPSSKDQEIRFVSLLCLHVHIRSSVIIPY